MKKADQEALVEMLWKFLTNKYFNNKGEIQMEYEVWKDVPGYEGHYQVSNMGRVKSIKFNKERMLVLSQYGRRKGNDYQHYYKVTLCANGKRQIFKVHRLVAMVFIPNPANLPQVNHKDENGFNNCVDNLEWCNNKYNSNYGTKRSRISNALKNKKN